MPMTLNAMRFKVSSAACNDVFDSRHSTLPVFAEFLSNVITTSRYKWYSFLFVFLFEQFSRLANFYFLIVRVFFCFSTSFTPLFCHLPSLLHALNMNAQICILQSIQSISITNGVPTSFIPLGFVIFFDGVVTVSKVPSSFCVRFCACVGVTLKASLRVSPLAPSVMPTGNSTESNHLSRLQVREDYVRHREDKRANARCVDVMRNGQLVSLPWKDVVVGDIVKVLRGQEFPADLVFLAAGHEDPEQRSVCHVQTAQLDGETNLKLRQAPEKVVEVLSSPEDCAVFRATLVCEEPNEHFQSFSGNLYVTSSVATAAATAGASPAE
jgi:hypothetical protein